MNNVSNDHTANSTLVPKVMQLIDTMKELVDRGVQHSDVTLADWDALKAVVETNGFQRVGPFHDEKDWKGYTELLTQWVNHAEGWRPVIRKVSEAPGVVYAQCEEMITEGDREFPFYSLSMYEFNDDLKIQRIYVYMQHEMAGEQQAG